MIRNQKAWEEMAATLKAAQSERDALAAQVVSQQALLKCWQTWLGSSRESCDDSGAKLWDKIEQACSATPQCHLNEVRAEAAKNAIDAVLNLPTFTAKSGDWLIKAIAWDNVLPFKNQYAAQIRSAKP